MAAIPPIVVHVHVHIEPDEGLALVLAKLDALQATENQEMADLSALTAAVEAETTVAQSAVTLLVQLHDMLVAAGTDPQALADLAATIQANTDALSAAVVANTPA